MIEGFGERLKAFLKARKITLAVCEQKTGISKNTLGSYINGSVNPSAMAIIRLATVIRHRKRRALYKVIVITPNP